MLKIVITTFQGMRRRLYALFVALNILLNMALIRVGRDTGVEYDDETELVLTLE